MICGVGVLIVTFGFPNVKNVEPEEELCGADLSKQTPRSRSMSSISEAASNMAEDNLDEALSTSEGLKETLLFGFKNPRFGLFIPIILYNGMSLGFFLSDATRYFIAEAIGAPCFGAAATTTEHRVSAVCADTMLIQATQTSGTYCRHFTESI